MSRGKGRYRADANAKPLIELARACGWIYVPLDSLVDGLLIRGDRVRIVDWKQPKTGKLTKRQQRLVDLRVPVNFVSTEDQLKTLLGVR